MLSRRSFIQKTGLASALMCIGSFPFKALAISKTQHISILFTNGNVMQEPSQITKQELEYLQWRADMIQKIRQEKTKVLLFDMGSLFSNSVYHQAFNGTLEIEAMNKMHYDVVGIGKQELNIETKILSEQLSKAKFTIVCSNYNLEKTGLNALIKPYCVIEIEGLKIGILGVEKGFDASNSELNIKSINSENPIKKVNELAHYLKKKQNCDFVVCLSRLGSKTSPYNPYTDQMLALETEDINLIISGQAMSSSNKAQKYYNLKKQEVILAQLGIGTNYLGRIDYIFSTEKNILSSNAQTVEIGK